MCVMNIIKFEHSMQKTRRWIHTFKCALYLLSYFHPQETPPPKNDFNVSHKVRWRNVSSPKPSFEGVLHRCLIHGNRRSHRVTATNSTLRAYVCMFSTVAFTFLVVLFFCISNSDNVRGTGDPWGTLCWKIWVLVSRSQGSFFGVEKKRIIQMQVCPNSNLWPVRP